MAAPVRATRMTLDEFLALPEEKPYLEFVNGEVQAKAMPNEKHGAVVAQLIIAIGIYLRQHAEARIVTEVRHATVSNVDQRVFLPDINVTPSTQYSGPPRTGLVRQHPAFAIEVLSPEDRPGRVADRVQFYLRNGTALLWLVDPEDESITVFRPGAEAQTAVAGDTLDAAPVLSAFSLDVAGLFAAVRD
ncbi:MAG: Uma2 family endonuclease [Dehalococcoidia bacterium]